VEHRRIDLWDMGFGSAVSVASQEACRRVKLSPCGCALAVLGDSRLTSLILSDDIRHAVLIRMGDRQCPVLYAELLR
jgi:hypothetical protein